MSEPKTQKLPTYSSASLLVSDDNPYQELYDRPLTKDETTEMDFNLVNFIETLIKMDRQHIDWLEKKKTEKEAAPAK